MAIISQEFKDRLVELHLTQGRSFADLSREFNVSATSISSWVRAAEGASGSEQRAGESDKARIARLERELARKEQELEILGKALAFFARRADQ